MAILATETRFGKVAHIDDYESRITEELRAYTEVGQVHDLPSIHDFWIARHVLPLFADIGSAGLDELWEEHISEQCVRCTPRTARLVSLGAGNGEYELPLVARLAERGLTNLEIVLLELNPSMLDRALEVAEELGLGDRVRVQATDLNTWVAGESADIYLAVHSLHHVVELEHLYDQVAHTLDPQGILLVNDMIGRNGHMRWPEAAGIVRRIWNTLPERYRFNHFIKQLEVAYPDLDCSAEGFEGIRSQDVLPLLLERFHADVFVAFGNVIDPFVDRVYGHNFDEDDVDDAIFIDTVARLDEAAIDLGILTPTHLVASFRPRPVPCRYPRQRSPERMVHAANPAGDTDTCANDVRSMQEQVQAISTRYDTLRARRAVQAALEVTELRNRISHAMHRRG